MTPELHLPSYLPPDIALLLEDGPDRTDEDRSYAEALAVALRYQEDVLEQTVARNPWIPFNPLPKQSVFLALPTEEALYGGALGGGKSEALLAAAAQYVDRPSYRALIIRKTIAELQMPGALIERSKQWWGGTGASYNANLHRWKFPSGAEIWFGYLGGKNWSRYQSSEWDFIGFDEVVTIPEAAYMLLFGRLRQNLLKTDLADVPPRVRAASNPPTADQEATGWWVKVRFVDRGFPYFIPAYANDNPYLEPGYFDRLRRMYDPITFAKLVRGDWEIRAAGGLFRRSMFKEIAAAPLRGIIGRARGWDLAGTAVSAASPDPDWTRGVLVSRHERGAFIIEDMVSLRDEPGAVANLLQMTAGLDGRSTTVVIPKDPAQAGKAQVQAYINLLAGYQVATADTIHRTRGSGGAKVSRATPFAIQARNGGIYVVKAPWNQAFYRELESFPGEGHHDDIVDAVAVGFNQVALTAPLDTRTSGWAASWGRV